MEVKSKFSFWNVYFLLVFIGGVSILGFYFLFHSEIILHTKFGTNMSASYLGLILCILCGWFFYYALKKIRKITVQSDEITLSASLKSRSISKAEIKSIDLFARKDLGFLSSSRNVNGIKIITTEEETYFIPDVYYKNSAEIKSSIQNSFQALVLKPSSIKNNIKEASTTILGNQDFEKFSGSFLFSFRGLLFIGFSLWMVYIGLFIKSHSDSPFIKLVLLIPIIIFYFGFGYQAHYFLVSSNELIIKNQLWWWKNVSYDLENIDDAVIEDGPKQSNALRINTKDFKSKKYPASSLRNKTWRELLERLNSLGVNSKSEVSI